MSTKPTIDASPTKELFIDMLTRDIPLLAAILDLVDNCVDGARRMRGSKRFDGLFVKITLSKNEFAIKDNCGGIPLETAEKNAFRFGRPHDAEPTNHSIGRFGVGLKRAIFKLGRHFTIESVTTADRFKTIVNVDDWAKLKEWVFPFDDRRENEPSRIEKTGTEITVTKLKVDVSEVFGRHTFGSELGEELQKKLSGSIENGLSVTINSVPVNANPVQLLANPKLAPASLEKKYKLDGETVTMLLYCGLGPSEDVTAAGWHVYCNGRLILCGDKTADTGWGSAETGISIPNFHGQYNLIRGYAFFDCDDAVYLPWNTTKTGINPDSVVYRAARLEMMRLMRPVVDFCNKLKEEKNRSEDSGETGPLQGIIEDSKVQLLDDIKTRPTFVLPRVATVVERSGPQLQRIQYDRPLPEVLEVKKALKARSYKEVGEKTFDYYRNAELKK